MILRGISDTPLFAASAKPRQIWDVLFEHQSKLIGAKECWLITQPSHSALSGEIAARLRSEIFGEFDEPTVRAIALHDAGWSQSDSEQIRSSRSANGARPDVDNMPFSFLGAAPKNAVNAWTNSVETALKAGALGGLLVSEHFRSIAQFQVNENPGKAKEMAAFARQEETRQKKLRTKIQIEASAIESLVDGLRFTDLLSLYLCAGLAEPVVFSQQFQQHSFALSTAEPGIFQLQPFPFQVEQTFSFAALRHPRTKSVSGTNFLCKVTG
jgi:hypothetical protein